MVLWQSQQLTAVQRTALGCVPPSPTRGNLKAIFKGTFSLWRFLAPCYATGSDTYLQPQLTPTKTDLTHPHAGRCLLGIAVSCWNKRKKKNKNQHNAKERPLKKKREPRFTLFQSLYLQPSCLTCWHARAREQRWIPSSNYSDQEN